MRKHVNKVEAMYLWFTPNLWSSLGSKIQGIEQAILSTWNVPRQSRQELTMSGMLVKINIRQQAIMEIVKETLVATIRN